MMKKQAKRWALLAVLSFLLLLGVTLAVAATAAEESPAWVADYTVEASCGRAGVVLGSFNGSSACVDAMTGHLHFCSANFPYSEMANTVYDEFTNDLSWSSEKMDATFNSDVCMSEQRALEVKVVDIHAHTRSKDETPTAQGIQYFTELVRFVYDGYGIYDGRYDDEDTMQSVDLSKNTKLKELELHYFSMEGIDLSANTELEKIMLLHESVGSIAADTSKYNGLARMKTLDLSKQKKLQHLTLIDQRIEELDLSNNPEIRYMSLRFLNKLEELDLGYTTKLADLIIYKCAIRELDLKEKPHMTILNCQLNSQLEWIGFDGCSALIDACVSRNKLQTIDLSHCQNLKYLECEQNELRSLDLSANKQLVFLECGHNRFTHLDLGEKTVLASPGVSGQSYEIGKVVDERYDLHNLPEGFDISRVRPKDTGDGEPYQFYVYGEKAFGAGGNRETVGEDLLLAVADDCCNISYDYYVGKNVSGKDIYMSVILTVEDNLYTVNCASDRVVLKEFNYNGGIGEALENPFTVRRGASTDAFVVELLPGYRASSDGIKVFYESSDQERVEAASYDWDGTTYYVINGKRAGENSSYGILKPTTVYVEGVVPEGGGVGGGEDDLPPEETTVLTDAASGISVSIPKNSEAAFSEGTVLEVEELPSDALSADAAASLAEEIAKEHKVLALYDLSLLLGGFKVQPGGSVKVTLPIPEDAGKYKKLQVMFLDADGAVAPCKTDVKGSAVTFETDHFSQYAVIGIGEGGGLGAGGVVGIVLASLVVLGLGGFAIYWFVLKKKSLEDLLALVRR